MYVGGRPERVENLASSRHTALRGMPAASGVTANCTRIEINYQAETLETAVCEAIVTYLGYRMPPCEIIDQLISRGFIRDPGNNAREDVVQRLADIAEQMRRERATQIP